MQKLFFYWLKRISLWGLFGVIVLTSAACNEEAVVQTNTVHDPVLVAVERPVVGDISFSIAFTGRVEPNTMINVLPRSEGTVLRMHAKVGDVMQEGDLLLEMDTTDVELGLAAQLAEVDVARAGVLAMQSKLDQVIGSQFDLEMAGLQSQIKEAQMQYSLARQELRNYADKKNVSLDKLKAQMDELNEEMPQIEDAAKSTKMDYDAELAILLAMDPVESPTEYERQQKIVDASKVNMERAQRLLDTSKSDLLQMGSEVRSADDKDAVSRGLKSTVGNARLAFDSSNTIYEMTKGALRDDSLKVINAQLGEATALLEAKTREYLLSAQKLTHTKVYAPISGVIESCNVTANAVVSPEEPVFIISSMQNVSVIFYVPAKTVQQMEVGDVVQVKDVNATYTGTLTEVGNMVDPEKGLFKIKAVIDGGKNLMTGLVVQIIAPIAKAQNALIIPQEAIYYDEDGGYVFVHQDGYAVKTHVEIGVTTAETVEVFSGVTKDSELVVTWNPKLADGAPIRIASDAKESA